MAYYLGAYSSGYAVPDYQSLLDKVDMKPRSESLVEATCEERNKVTLMIRNKMRSVNITSIKTVKNNFLEGMYQLKKDEYRSRHGIANELLLLHATAASNVSSIIKNNFDWRKTKRGKFGMGSSFSDDAQYANRYANRLIGSKRAFIITKVLVARLMGGSQNLKVPPSQYDTTTGNASKVYVKFNDHETLPLYIIYYDNDDSSSFHRSKEIYPQHIAYHDYGSSSFRRSTERRQQPIPYHGNGPSSFHSSTERRPQPIAYHGNGSSSIRSNTEIRPQPIGPHGNGSSLRRSTEICPQPIANHGNGSSSFHSSTERPPQPIAYHGNGSSSLRSSTEIRPQPIANHGNASSSFRSSTEIRVQPIAYHGNGSSSSRSSMEIRPKPIANHCNGYTSLRNITEIRPQPIANHGNGSSSLRSSITRYNTSGGSTKGCCSIL